MRPKVLAYYFPNYHVDRRNEAWQGKGWTEWDLVRSATPRFPGHHQPRVPLLGYQDESDPVVAAQHIDLAAEYGIDGFIFDYYWYDDGPYLEGALERGFLQAENNEKLEFSVMWANHDLLDIFPRAHPHDAPKLLKSGAVERAAFERMAEHLIEHYFGRPNYTRIAGRHRFSIYEIGQFVKGLGGVDEARDALEWFDARTREAGYEGVHVDAVIWGFAVLPSEVEIQRPAELLTHLRVASTSSYVWIHHQDVSDETFPVAKSWRSVGEAAYEAYEAYVPELPVTIHPNVSVGWDSSPRCSPEQPFVAAGYPWISVWEPSPEAFERGLEDARDFCLRHPEAYQEVTINAWNEWTEGSYLLPDEENGYAYLNAIRSVFGVRADPGSSAHHRDPLT